MVTMKQGIDCVLWLKKVAWDSTTGGTLIFEVTEEDLEQFKGLPTKVGRKAAGQRFAAVMVLIGEDEKPIPIPEDPKPEPKPDPKKEEGTKGGGHKSHFPGGLCGLAIRWCDDPHFQDWLDNSGFGSFAKAAEMAKTPEEQAKMCVLEECRIKSRKELDSDKLAAESFRVKFVEPYKLARKADGVDEENF